MSGSPDREFEVYYSPSNRNGNYELFLENDFVGGDICLGYIKSEKEQEL
jgi:hypothetical protein